MVGALIDSHVQVAGTGSSCTKSVLAYTNILPVEERGETRMISWWYSAACGKEHGADTNKQGAAEARGVGIPPSLTFV
jgi:hypothetical protein